MDTEQQTQTIRKHIEDGKVVIGTKRSLKLVRSGAVSRVFVTSNTPADVQDDLKHYCGISDIPLEVMQINNRELGVICKKPFLVSVLAIRK